jgi:hypothetical protein
MLTDAQVSAQIGSGLWFGTDEGGLTHYPTTYYHTDAILCSGNDLVPERKTNEFWFRGVTVAFKIRIFLRTLEVR